MSLQASTTISHVHTARGIAQYVRALTGRTYEALTAVIGWAQSSQPHDREHTMEIMKLTKYANKYTQYHALVLDVTSTTVTYLIWCPADRWSEGAYTMAPSEASHAAFREVWEEWA